jgi:hypothetical protein
MSFERQHAFVKGGLVTHNIANELTSRNKAETCHKITNCHTRQLRLSTVMDISVKELQEAISIRHQIDNLQRRLSSLLRGAPQRPTAPAAPTAAGRYFSPATRAKLAAAARARWARTRGTAGATAAPARRKGQLTPAGRRKLSQLMKARWAARRKAGGTKKPSGRKKGALTPAGRKRLSELMKARWAARRRAGK